MKIAVVAHAKKNLGGGLPALRAELRCRGQMNVAWDEVTKSKKVPDAVRDALAADPDVLLLWGGDGTIQRGLDTVARKAMPDVPIAVLPAGTSNLFASNFDIPHDLSRALDVALGGVSRRIDVGSFNGERFGVMAGVGFDALMIRDSSRRMKDRLGRAAYVYGSEEPETSLGGRRGARAETLPVVAIAAVAFVSLRVILRRWREAALITLAVAGEAAIFVCITALVDRERPDVMRLDEAPPTSSFPSGHASAAVALYGRLAVVAWLAAAPVVLRVLSTVVAVLVPLAVGVSRMYRGMHHLTDVLGGLALGGIWLCLVTLVIVAATHQRAAADRREPVPVP